jgi:hypothetical protein
MLTVLVTSIQNDSGCSVETALHTMRLQLDQYNDVKQSEVLACFISPLGPVAEDTAELQIWGTRENRKVSN